MMEDICDSILVPLDAVSCNNATHQLKHQYKHIENEPSLILKTGRKDLQAGVRWFFKVHE